MIQPPPSKLSPYIWLPPFHWRDGEGGSPPCRHHAMAVSNRPATGKAVRGEVRYWLACPRCGLEVGPFVSESQAVRWDATRAARDDARSR
jgi:hypothetical protein